LDRYQISNSRHTKFQPGLRRLAFVLSILRLYQAVVRFRFKCQFDDA